MLLGIVGLSTIYNNNTTRNIQLLHIGVHYVAKRIMNAAPQLHLLQRYNIFSSSTIPIIKSINKRTVVLVVTLTIVNRELKPDGIIGQSDMSLRTSFQITNRVTTKIDKDLKFKGMVALIPSLIHLEDEFQWLLHFQ